jgi:hypothetical protein
MSYIIIYLEHPQPRCRKVGHPNPDVVSSWTFAESFYISFGSVKKNVSLAFPQFIASSSELNINFPCAEHPHAFILFRMGCYYTPVLISIVFKLHLFYGGFAIYLDPPSSHQNWWHQKNIPKKMPNSFEASLK